MLSAFPTTAKAARARNIVQITGADLSHTAYQDCRKLAAEAGADYTLSATIAGLNNAAIAQTPYFAVHSGVASRDGRIVALPAESGHGKTTLTATLVRSGFDFISDEALVFDDNGSVLPYPKPFALTPWSADQVDVPAGDEEVLVTAADLGGRNGRPGPLTDLVLSEYGHASAVIEPLPRSEAVAALIRYSFNHFKDPARAFKIATEVAREVAVWRLEYDDPGDAAALLSDTLG